MADNKAKPEVGDGFGGGVWISGSKIRMEMINSTIANNRAEGGELGEYPEGGGLYIASIEELQIYNTIIWGNEAQSHKQIRPPSVGTLEIAFSNIQDCCQLDECGDPNAQVCPAFGNMDTNPLFEDAEEGDYRLQETSPCIDAGN